MNRTVSVDVGAYRENGFLVVKRLLDAERVGRASKELGLLAEHEAEYPPGSFVLEDNHEEIRKSSRNPLDWIRKIDYPAMSRSRYLMDLFQDGSAEIVRICAQLAGESELRLVFLSTFAKPPRVGSEVPWHQDQALWDLWMENAVSGWVALSRTTDENGVLQVIPGSHARGMAPHGHYDGKIHESIRIADYPDARPEKLYMNPGDVVFFGGKTWHYSGPNRSEERRLGMPVVYAGAKDLRAGIDCDSWLSSKLTMEKPMTTLPMAGARRRYYEERPVVVTSAL